MNQVVHINGIHGPKSWFEYMVHFGYRMFRNKYDRWSGQQMYLELKVRRVNQYEPNDHVQIEMEVTTFHPSGQRREASGSFHLPASQIENFVAALRGVELKDGE